MRTTWRSIQSRRTRPCVTSSALPRGGAARPRPHRDRPTRINGVELRRDRRLAVWHRICVDAGLELASMLRRRPKEERASAESPMAPPFWVIGAPRSGTTFLARVLDHHPDIFLTNETRLMLLFSRMLNRWVGARRLLATSCDEVIESLWQQVPGMCRADIPRSWGSTGSAMGRQVSPVRRRRRRIPRLWRRSTDSFQRANMSTSFVIPGRSLRPSCRRGGSASMRRSKHGVPS